MTEIAPGATSKSYTADHVANIHLDEPAGVDDFAVGEGGALAAAPGAVMTEAEFYEVFEGTFALAAWGGDMAGYPLPSLPVQPDERDTARRASDGLYKLATLHPRLLGWMIRPGNETMQACIPLVLFGAAKARGVAVDLRAARVQPVNGNVERDGEMVYG